MLCFKCSEYIFLKTYFVIGLILRDRSYKRVYSLKVYYQSMLLVQKRILIKLREKEDDAYIKTIRLDLNGVCISGESSEN